MNPPANAGDIEVMGSIPGSGRSPGGGHGNPLQYSCLDNPMDRGSWGCKELDIISIAAAGTFLYSFKYVYSLLAQMVKNPPAMQETWVQSLGWEDPLEKGIATHSSILAWRIPWTIQSMGLQRVVQLSDFHSDSDSVHIYNGILLGHKKE